MQVQQYYSVDWQIFACSYYIGIDTKTICQIHLVNSEHEIEQIPEKCRIIDNTNIFFIFIILFSKNCVAPNTNWLVWPKRLKINGKKKKIIINYNNNIGMIESNIRIADLFIYSVEKYVKGIFYGISLKIK